MKKVYNFLERQHILLMLSGLFSFKLDIIYIYVKIGVNQNFVNTNYDLLSILLTSVVAILSVMNFWEHNLTKVMNEYHS
jgi:hypothetical protein